MSDPEREKPSDPEKFVLRVTASKEDDGGFVAQASGFDIFSQGDAWDELCANVRESVKAYFSDGRGPSSIVLQLIETIPVNLGNKTTGKVESRIMPYPTKIEILE